MTSLNVGDKAPNFVALNEFGQSISLSEFLGKKIVLYFYPKDMTPGCTAESCNLSENYSLLQEKGFIVLGVSPDSSKSHQKFIDAGAKLQIPQAMLTQLQIYQAVLEKSEGLPTKCAWYFLPDKNFQDLYSSLIIILFNFLSL